MSIRSESCRTYFDPGPAFEAYKPSGEAELYGPIKRWGHIVSGYRITRAKKQQQQKTTTTTTTSVCVNVELMEKTGKLLYFVIWTRVK